MEVFAGINTATTRAGVDDKMCYWIDGFMPLAPRCLRTLPGAGSAIYTAAGKSVVFFKFFNLDSTPYVAIFGNDGSLDILNIANQTLYSNVLAATTISSPSILNCDITQWAQQYLIIVSNQTNGYWIWDGALIYTAGTLGPVITITNNGLGYSSSTFAVSIVGGFGGGVSIAASIANGEIISMSFVNPGVGFLASDTLSVSINAPVAGSGGSVAITGYQEFVYESRTAYSLTGVSVAAGGVSYVNPNASIVYAIGSGGPTVIAIQPVIQLFVDNPPSSIFAASIVNPGVFYSTSGHPGMPSATVVISASVVQASASVQLMPFGIQGTTVETAFGRVWVANENEISFTAPGSFVDFATSDGGGNFSSGDSFLRVKFVRLVNTNGFLYLVADSSMNYISGVQTSGDPPTTTFTNQNADPEVGTPYPAGVLLLGRDILLANSWGVHQSRGATLDKISEALDGVWPQATLSAQGSTVQLSTAKATIFNKRVWMVLAPIQDPVSGEVQNKLLMYRDKMWWASLQNVGMTYVAAQEINSVLTTYATEGTSIYPLFSAPSTAFTKVVQSRLWDTPGGIGMAKAVGRFWSLWNFNTVSATPSVLLTLDMVGTSTAGLTIETPQTYTLSGPASPGWLVTPPEAVGQQGVLLGMTLQTTEGDVELVTAMIQPDPRVAYRG